MKIIQVSNNVQNSDVRYFSVTNKFYNYILDNYVFWGGFRRINIALYDEPKKAKNENQNFVNWIKSEVFVAK